MRIAYLAAGAGAMYCGACHRDAALFQALASTGHELRVIPLYTPLRTDRPLTCSLSPIFMGGVNMYLEQAFSFYHHLPPAFRRQFDRPGLLRRVSRMAVQTSPAKLGPLTVGMLAGVAGPHAQEIQRLVQYLRTQVRPDVVNLSNSMLASLAEPIRTALNVPVVCTMQGEESFIEALVEPYRGQALTWLRRHAAAIDRFVCCALERVPVMAAWLQVPAERFAVIPTGIDPAPYAPPPDPARTTRTGPLVLGYLSSIRPEKGLDLLLEALRLLVQSHRRHVRLEIAGQILDKIFWRQIQATIQQAGLTPHVTFRGELDLAGKVAFLQGCDLFVMPTRLPESRAVAAMEALAAGVPVVASHLGVMPELLAQTGGGITVAPDNAPALAQAILTLCDDPAQMRAYAERGPEGIARHYSLAVMAQRMLGEYEGVTRGALTESNRHAP